MNMAGNETDEKERGGKNGGERAARLEPGCGGDGDDGESSKGVGGGVDECLHHLWLSNSPSSLLSSTDVRLATRQHFYSNCSETEMEAIQSHDVVGWRQLHSHRNMHINMHTQQLYSITST